MINLDHSIVFKLGKNKVSESKKNILIVANCTWYLYNFRRDLLQDLSTQGYNLILLSTLDKYFVHIEKNFYKVKKLFLMRGSENLILEFFTILNILFCYLKYKPVLVHHFTIKPAIYGSLISRLLNIKYVINHITGLGPSFFSNRTNIKILNKILYPIYKYSFNFKNTKTIFHNISDRDFFINKKFIKLENAKIIKGSGVNTTFYNNEIEKKSFNKEIQILFPARLIKEKGIIELINACNELWKENYHFILNIVGDIDSQNKSSLKKNDLIEIKGNKKIKLLGKSNKMREIYKKMDIVVLPSWREGLSKSLLESSSMKLPIITSDVPGCRDLIKHRHSGLLVPPKNKDQLKKAIKEYLDKPKLAIEYGINARKSVLKEFTTITINKKIIKIYDDLLNK